MKKRSLNPKKTVAIPPRYKGVSATRWSQKINSATMSQVRNYMGRVHVGTPDEEVFADIQKRIGKEHVNTKLGRGVVDYALKVHHENRKLYTDVMGGSLSRPKAKAPKAKKVVGNPVSRKRNPQTPEDGEERLLWSKKLAKESRGKPTYLCPSCVRRGVAHPSKISAAYKARGYQCDACCARDEGY